MTKLQKNLLYSLLAAAAVFVTMHGLAVDYGRRYFILNNVFWAQFAGLLCLYLLSRNEAKNTRIVRGLKAALLATVLLVITGFMVARYGPGVATEVSHTSAIRYTCEYYGDDLPFLQGQSEACVVKNPVTAASNPAWLLIDRLGVPDRRQERISKLLTFVMFEAIIGGSYLAFARKQSKKPDSSQA